MWKEIEVEWFDEYSESIVTTYKKVWIEEGDYYGEEDC